MKVIPTLIRSAFVNFAKGDRERRLYLNLENVISRDE